uniref:Uncharacterized protein n=1 Tax=Amphimedon queenslandica TaxID=400682 RepID=A0A1X7UNJ7_AMPQE
MATLLPSSHLLLALKCLIPIVMITNAIVRVNLLPFNIDQLIGSSSDELTAVILWHNTGPIIAIISSSAITAEVNSELTVSIISLAIGVFCIATVLISHSLFKKYLEVTPVNTVNPLKIIIQVLCYARKHKYPENRSALTYWEEEAPSRLELGKNKYGGPFTEEEVEDVKTTLRLLPLLIICAASSSLYGDNTQGIYSNNYGCGGSLKSYMSFVGTYILIVLLHQFLIYPCFYNYVPSMLKRIGIGMLLMVVINATLMVLALIGNYNSAPMFHCLTVYKVESNIEPQKWDIIDGIALALVWYSFNVVLVEFLQAQCPKSIRGTIVGLWLCFRDLRHYVNFALFLPFLIFMDPKFSLGRGFYFCLTEAMICLILLLIYVILAKQYKLRVRNFEINIHQIAEDHTIRNIEQDEEYWNNREISAEMSH